VAGYLMFSSIKGSRKKWIGKKSLQLLIPHFLFNMAFYYLSFIGISEFSSTMHDTSFGVYMYRATFIDTGEWFLWTLFLICPVMLFVDWASTIYNNRLTFIIIGIAVFVAIIPLKQNIFRLMYLQYYLPIALAGYLVAKYKPRINLKYVLMSLPIMLGLFVAVMFASHGIGGWGYIAIANPSTNLSAYLLRYAQVITVAPLVYLIVVGISKVKIFAKGFSKIGKLTLGIYLFDLMFAGLFIGKGIIAVITGSIIALTIGIILTKLITKDKQLGIILGDTSILTRAT
jgi:hypothetical protein